MSPTRRMTGEAQTWQESMAVGRWSVEEIIARNQLACVQVRDLLVEYVKHPGSNA